MLKKIRIENFGPIDKATELSFEKGRTEQFPENLIGETGLLRTLYIYGANNCGKSQISKSIQILKDLAEGRSFFDPSNRYYHNFQNVNSKSKMTYFFNFNNTEYIYTIEFSFIDKVIYHENLKVDTSVIFNRKKNQIEQSEKEIENDIFYLTSQYNKEGCNEYINKLYTYCKEVIYIDQQKKGNLQFYNEDQQLIYIESNESKLNELLQKFGFDFELKVSQLGSNLQDSKLLESRKRCLKDIKGKNLLMPFDIMESFGTKTFLNLLVNIEMTKSEEGIVVIDEIERGIHFALVIEFLEYLNKEYPKKQFIIPTHTTDILGNELNVRKDQVYISEIKDAKLHLNRKFNKKHIRETMNFQKIYKSNSVGGIPVIGKISD